MTARKNKDLGLAVKILRYVEFLTVSLILRWPIWILLAMLKPFKIFRYLFLVYPGTDSDLDGYCPRQLARSWVFSKQPTIGGIISKGSGGRGLILVVPNTTDEFENKKNVCNEVTRRLVWIQQIVGAKSIALAGRLPSIISRDGNTLDNPFVKGNKGTVFCVMETVSQVMQRHGLNIDHTKIAIVGVGYVGKLLLDALKVENYKEVAGIDIQGDGEILRKADIVVVLTPRGKDFVPYIKYLKKDAIIIDDTHPKITEQPPGMTFYKVAVGMDGVRFYPRLPGYKQNWIPGCAVEAMVAAATGDFNGTSQEEFNQRAKNLGFFARMVR